VAGPMPSADIDKMDILDLMNDDGDDDKEDKEPYVGEDLLVITFL
jgi:hypothetical protein